MNIPSWRIVWYPTVRMKSKTIRKNAIMDGGGDRKEEDWERKIICDLKVNMNFNLTMPLIQ